jgi:hypothetical protein
MVTEFDEYHFNFDRIELEDLKTMKYDEIFDQLKSISKSFISLGEIESIKKFKFPNILFACNEITKGDKIMYCDGQKLIIPENKLDDMLQILSDDIMNPLKWKWLFNNIFVENIVNYFKFTKRPMESISILFE